MSQENDDGNQLQNIINVRSDHSSESYSTSDSGTLTDGSIFLES